MPLYEYLCRRCERRFEKFVVRAASPVCPSCDSRKVSKLLSVFAVGSRDDTARSERQPGPCGSCGDPRGPGACSMN